MPPCTLHTPGITLTRPPTRLVMLPSPHLNHMFMHRTPRHHVPCSPPPCTMHCTAADFTPHPHTPCSTTNQLNKHLDEMTAALARVPNTTQNKPPQPRLRSGRYQPYNSGQGTDAASRPNDENTHSIRPTNAHKKAKVGSTNVGAHDQNFTGSADPRGLSACTICLSRNPHNVTQCDANLLWDQSMFTL
jgi:hypothetical protein